jgi:NAD(P)-dependent dehydrogenase (short-subunit alcohol dehydrogenase family)
MEKISLSGRVVVVTGAGRGIGAAIAQACAARGARLVVNDIDAAAADAVVAQIREAGGEACADSSDVATWQGAQALVAQALERFGRIDGLVNNAGIYRLSLPHESTEAEIRDILQVNVMGTMFCTTHAVRHMRSAGGGAIVNVTSGAQAGMPAMSVYGASKGAVASYTYACALDLQADGIRVNALSPMARTRMDEVNETYHSGRSSAFSPIAQEAADNAPAVCFLLSDAAAGITGQVVRVVGDRLALMTHPAIAAPVLQVDRGSVEAVEAAFRESLRARLIPAGLVTVTQARVDPE